MYPFWENWLLYHKVVFDGINKLITVDAGVTALNIRTDVYSSWVEWIETEDNARFLPAMRYTGLDVIPGGFTGDTYFLINGWKLLIDFSKVAVSGVLFSDNFNTAYYTYNGIAQFPAVVSALINTVSVPQNVVTGDLSSIPTAAANAAAVRANLIPELGHILSLQNGQGLSSTQATMLLEIYRLYGLDVTRPLVVTNTSRTAGEITQTINTNTNQTVVTRSP